MPGIALKKEPQIKFMKYMFAALCILFFCLLINFYNWDIDILKQINLNRNKELDGVFILITHTALGITYATPLLLLLTAIIKHDFISQEKALCIIPSILFSVTFNALIKFFVNRTAPFITYTFIQNAVRAKLTSFPSEQTTNAFALAACLSLLYPKWYVIIPLYLWACIVAYSGIHLGINYPTDVFASVLLGASISLIWFKVYKRYIV